MSTRPAPTDTHIHEIPKLLRVDVPYDKPMMFVVLPDREVIYEDVGPLQVDSTVEVTLQVESFVRMSRLSPEVQKIVRAELGLTPRDEVAHFHGEEAGKEVDAIEKQIRLDEASGARVRTEYTREMYEAREAEQDKKEVADEQNDAMALTKE